MQLSLYILTLIVYLCDGKTARDASNTDPLSDAQLIALATGNQSIDNQSIGQQSIANVKNQTNVDNGKDALVLIDRLLRQHPELKLGAFDVKVNMRFGGDSCGRCGKQHSHEQCDAKPADTPAPANKNEEVQAPTTTPGPPPTTTRPTCVAEKTLNQADLCSQKVATGKKATRACQAQCYVTDQSHYRNATCDTSGGSSLCRCFFDPCRMSEMDIVFLLDSSASLSQTEFKQEVDFISSFVSKMQLGSDRSRAALIQFSTIATERFNFLDTPQNQLDIKQRLNNLQHEHGLTNITGAFWVAAPLLASTKRDQVDQVAVLITDGFHNQGVIPPSVPAAKLRADGVLTYCLGVGGGVSRQSLVDICGDDDHVFIAQFSDLNFVVNIIGAEVTGKVNS